VGYLELLPLSMREIDDTNMNIDTLIYNGSYSSIYGEKVLPYLWYPNYIRTYIERDVRLLKNVSDLSSFERFVRLCAGRLGQIINKSAIATEIGYDSKTIESWLEASYIIYRLQPYHNNYNKRVIKAPKLYFYHTGLAAHLLGVMKEDHLNNHPLRGPLFENLIISD
jgi:uncharacterized protein